MAMQMYLEKRGKVVKLLTVALDPLNVMTQEAINSAHYFYNSRTDHFVKRLITDIDVGLSYQSKRPLDI